jgi:hypothetical protein
VRSNSRHGTFPPRGMNLQAPCLAASCAGAPALVAGGGAAGSVEGGAAFAGATWSLAVGWMGCAGGDAGAGFAAGPVDDAAGAGVSTGSVFAGAGREVGAIRSVSPCVAYWASLAGLCSHKTSKSVIGSPNQLPGQHEPEDRQKGFSPCMLASSPST